MTATIAATQRAAITPTVKTFMGSIAAAVALATGTLLFAAPAADARPTKEVEEMMSDCRYAKGKFVRVTARDYSCTLPFVNGRQDQWNMDNLGNTRSICYRFSVETAWVCQ
ncbi:hypothetical protein MycrhDRAFT_5565 [Mycolicibacterium rhodesiae JS60]|nr:hypothetical protein MycrhDRAFT_5565 [Mycolicibacterium rhodesiae JS60]